MDHFPTNWGKPVRFDLWLVYFSGLVRIFLWTGSRFRLLGRCLHGKNDRHDGEGEWDRRRRHKIAMGGVLEMDIRMHWEGRIPGKSKPAPTGAICCAIANTAEGAIRRCLAHSHAFFPHSIPFITIPSFLCPPYPVPEITNSFSTAPRPRRPIRDIPYSSSWALCRIR